MNIFVPFSLLPLQVNLSNFEIRKDGNTAIYFIIGVGIIILLVAILNTLKSKFNVSALNGTTSKNAEAGERRFSLRTMYRIKRSLGLTRGQAKMLGFVLRSDGVTDPERSLNSPNLLDRHFKRAFRLIEQTSTSENDLNERLAALFTLRNIIETNLGSVTTRSTRQIPHNTAGVLSVGQLSYPVRVLSSSGDTLLIENPSDKSHKSLDLSKGSKVELSFFANTNKGFSVESRVMGHEDTEDGPALKLVHSGQLKRLSKRRFHRRKMVISTTFSYVHPATGAKGKNKKSKKLIVDKQKNAGSIVDISVGGCAIKTNIVLHVGQLLKIEFTCENNAVIAILGEVLCGTNEGSGMTFHVKFLKVPRKSLNSINIMVYDYA